MFSFSMYIRYAWFIWAHFRLFVSNESVKKKKSQMDLFESSIKGFSRSVAFYVLFVFFLFFLSNYYQIIISIIRYWIFVRQVTVSRFSDLVCLDCSVSHKKTLIHWFVSVITHKFSSSVYICFCEKISI